MHADYKKYYISMYYTSRSVEVLVMRDRTSQSLSRTAFPDNLLCPGRPALAVALHKTQGGAPQRPQMT